MTRKILLGLCCLLLLVFLTTSGLSSYAQTQPRITQAIDERAYVTLYGNTRPEAKNAINYRGPVAAAMPIDHMLLFLQRAPEQRSEEHTSELQSLREPECRPICCTAPRARSPRPPSATAARSRPPCPSTTCCCFSSALPS